MVGEGEGERGKGKEDQETIYTHARYCRIAATVFIKLNRVFIRIESVYIPSQLKYNCYFKKLLDSYYTGDFMKKVPTATCTLRDR